MTPKEFCLKALEHRTDECLLWPFKSLTAGYGVLRYEGRSWLAHRLVCYLTHGDPPTPKHTDAAHKCRNRHCISPQHVDWKTAKENRGDDRKRDGTNRAGENCGRAVLTEVQALEIRSLLEKGVVSGIEIAARYGVCLATISCIATGHSWAHLGPPIYPPGSAGEMNPMAKLNDEKVREIKRLLEAGEFQRVIAKMFGVSRSTIAAIKQQRCWTHVK